MIEISRKKSSYIYRLNPWNSLIIDRRSNSHRGLWKWFRLFKTEAEARAALLQLDRPDANGKGSDAP